MKKIILLGVLDTFSKPIPFFIRFVRMRQFKIVVLIFHLTYLVPKPILNKYDGHYRRSVKIRSLSTSTIERLAKVLPTKPAHVAGLLLMFRLRV